MQIRTYRLNWTNTHAAEANQTGALMTGSEYIQLACFECDQQDWDKFNSKEWMHIRVVQTAVSPLECSGQEASKSISYFSYLAKDCSIPENCSLWQIQFSTWCLHGNLPPVSKSLRLRKNFFSSYFNHSSAFWLVLCSQMPKSREEKSSYAPLPPPHYETTQ